MKRAGSLALVFFGLLAFFNAIRHPFVHDDVVFILQNPHITDLRHWYKAFEIPAASGGINTYYRPVLEVLYRLQYFLFGGKAWGFHLFNILVHITNGLLIFALLKKLDIAEHVAWIVALLFLIHPVQTEAVSCIAGISNLWMGLGVLAALYTYLNKQYALSFLFFVMAFLSKEQAVMFVPLLMVIDYSRGKKRLGAWFIWIFIAIILLGVRHMVTGVSLFKEIMVSPGELYLRLLAIPRDLGMYVRLIFFPYDLHYYRSTDILQPNTLAWVLFGFSLMGIAYAMKRWPQARKTIILGLGWFIAALLPVLNIEPLINEYSFILTPEHFLYLPIVGILIITVVAIDYFFKRLKWVVLGLIVASCLMLTWYQNTFWASEISLFERMLVFEPDFGRGQLLLAKAYYFNGQPQKADGHFQKAFHIMTVYENKAGNETARKFYLMFMKEILFDWAQNDVAMGRWNNALDKLKQQASVDGGDAAGYNNMAFIYAHLGDKKDAIASLSHALQLDPAFADARHNLQMLQTP